MKEKDVVLRGVVEADETFVGGKAKRWPDKELGVAQLGTFLFCYL